uniref:Uncharacterized protein n=1 Tax=Cacopsylla melanoneura TaxID=428564 RepID=A0A8D8QEX1_9HEMI
MYFDESKNENIIDNRFILVRPRYCFENFNCYLFYFVTYFISQRRGCVHKIAFVILTFILYFECCPSAFNIPIHLEHEKQPSCYLLQKSLFRNPDALICPEK